MFPKLICCRVMIEELREFLPAEISIDVLEISLHLNPSNLHKQLQDAINLADGRYDPIYLGYGMCSQAAVGLVAQKSHLIIPKSDDCIEIFLGSREARMQELATEPGTYFLTQGYVGDGASMIFAEYERSVARYGEARAERLLQSMMAHYKRLVYIHTPKENNLDAQRAYAKALAERFNMKNVEVPGTTRWLKQMMSPERGEEFIVAEPGHPIDLAQFLAK